jgi:hypothetical protein
MQDVLQRFFQLGWESYIVGGTLRDLSFAPSGVIPRDIDIIVNGPTSAELSHVFEDILARRTMFGGLHLIKEVHPITGSNCSYEIAFDVWPLSETWAIKNFQLPPKIERFPQTPFLNVDSVAIELKMGKGKKRQVYECGFFDAINRRLLEINFEPNPFPAVCIIRSLIMSAKLEFHIGLKLAKFIRRWAKELGIEELMKAQTAHYGQIRVEKEELEYWLGIVDRQLKWNQTPIALHTQKSVQQRLWTDWPPIHSESVPDNQVVSNNPVTKDTEELSGFSGASDPF